MIRVSTLYGLTKDGKPQHIDISTNHAEIQQLAYKIVEDQGHYQGKQFSEIFLQTSANPVTFRKKFSATLSILTTERVAAAKEQEASVAIQAVKDLEQKLTEAKATAKAANTHLKSVNKSISQEQVAQLKSLQDEVTKTYKAMTDADKAADDLQAASETVSDANREEIESRAKRAQEAATKATIAYHEADKAWRAAKPVDLREAEASANDADSAVDALQVELKAAEIRKKDLLKAAADAQKTATKTKAQD